MFLCGELQCIKGKLDLILGIEAVALLPGLRIVEFTLWMRSGVLQDSPLLLKTFVCPCCLVCKL